MPEHAWLVIDNEKKEKRTCKYKKRSKKTIHENIKVCNNIKLAENKKRGKETLFDKIMNDKILITINGTQIV